MAAAARLPWLKFYPADWRADLGLRQCSLEARGLWIELLSIMHEATPRGSLLVNGKSPSDALLAALTGASVKTIANAMNELRQAGVFGIDLDGTLFSRRMRRDDVASEFGRLNGMRGGNPRLKPNQTEQDKRGVNPLVNREDNRPDNSPPYTKNQNQNQNQNQKPEREKRAERDARERASFDRFWAVWPNKVGRTAALKAFAKVAEEIEEILAGVAAYVRSKPPDRPWLNPKTFIDQRRWEDQPAANPPPRVNGAQDRTRQFIKETFGAINDDPSLDFDQIDNGAPILDLAAEPRDD